MANNVSSYLAAAILNWSTRAAAAVQPAGCFLGLDVGTPNYTAVNEMGALTGYTRLTASFAPAASPAGSASNGVAMTFGPFSSIGSILGAHVWDAAADGSQLFQGLLATARTIFPGDFMYLSAGALSISMG